MASTTKEITPSDILSTQTDLYESIPITGSILYGTYPEPSLPNSNIKEYSHGMYQTVYDYPYTSSSANQLFDIAVGLSSESSLYAASSVSPSQTISSLASIKLNMYNQMAQVLSGYDSENTLQRFDKDGNLAPAMPGDDTKYDDVFFMAFSRVLTKDSIKKGSFELKLKTGEHGSAIGQPTETVSDSYSSGNGYFVNSPAGEYGLLEDESNNRVGLIYYDAGIVVLSKDVFSGISNFDGSNNTCEDMLRDDSVNSFANILRERIENVKFNNISELNSTVYHCRVNGSDFNYSTNPTYLSQSQIVVKDSASDSPVSYVTGVGLYSANGELLAVAKLSEPIKNDPTKDFTIKVRLDY